MKMSRRQFLGTSVAAVAVAACGGDDDKTDAAIAGRNCATNGGKVVIADNHGHMIAVTASDVAAGLEKTYTLAQDAGHMHTVTVTAANFATLQSNSNGSVMVTSTTTNAHMHSVTITCA